MGRVYKPKYAYTRADGTRVEKQTEAWYIEYGDASGRWTRRKAGITKEQAQDALRKAEADVLSEKNGLPTRRAADLACNELAQAYLTAQKPRVSAKQWLRFHNQLNAIFQGCRAHMLKDLKPERMESFLCQLADTGFSARTVNSYLQSIKGMLNWAVRTRRLPYNPLDCVARRSELGSRRRVRRALNDDELRRLLASALLGPERRMARAYRGGHIPSCVQAELDLQGRRNTLIYRVLVETGLRVGEARALTWADVDLDKATLTTRPQWVGNKNKKEETLPCSEGLTAALRDWRAAKPAGDADPVLSMPANFVNTFYDDIEAAGIPRQDAAGRVLDLHALRHTFGSRLVAAGVDIKTVQSLMRHSTPVLTLGIYVHCDRARLRQAVEQLPVLAPLPQESATAAMLMADAGA
jgi:integrase